MILCLLTKPNKGQSPKKNYRDTSARSNSAKSIKFQNDMTNSSNLISQKDSWGPSGILKSRPSTKLSGTINYPFRKLEEKKIRSFKKKMLIA